jgi:hypothetical protein
MSEQPMSDADIPLEFPARVRLDRLDAAADPAGFDRIVRSIVADAAAQRARGVSQSALGAIASFSRPALAAAALILILAGVALTMLPKPADAAPASFAETAGISPSLVQWSSDNHSPTPDELLGAIAPRATRSTP